MPYDCFALLALGGAFFSSVLRVYGRRRFLPKPLTPEEENGYCADAGGG